jgi:deoxyribodipyrimidine photo-lyase
MSASSGSSVWFRQDLQRLPTGRIHKPWEASDSELTAAGLQLGSTYPLPLIDHREARSRALDAHRQVKLSFQLAHKTVP